MDKIIAIILGMILGILFYNFFTMNQINNDETNTGCTDREIEVDNRLRDLEINNLKEDCENKGGEFYYTSWRVYMGDVLSDYIIVCSVDDKEYYPYDGEWLRKDKL